MGWGVSVDAGTPREKSISVVVKDFLADAWKSVVAGDMAGSTHTLYVVTMNKLLKFLGSKSSLGISKLDRKLVQDFMDWLFTDGKLSVGTRRTMKSHIQKLCTFCALNEYEGFKQIAFKFVVIRGEKEIKEELKPRDKAVSLDDVQKVMELIPFYYRGITKFLATTGCRVSEACNLRWDSVELQEDGAWISFVPYVRENGTKYRPKTANSIRRFWVGLATVEAMKAGGSDGSGLVFRSISDRTSKVSEKSLSFVISRAFRELGYPARVSCHAFRHTHITLGADNNVPRNALMNRVGIGTSKIMDGYYNNTDETDKKLGKVFEDDIKGC